VALIITDDSTMGRELWRWNHTVREVHPADEDKPRDQQMHGLRPVVYPQYPRMLYKAHKHPQSGKVLCRDVEPNPVYFTDQNSYERACLFVQTFNKSCELIVQSEDEHEKEKKNGWKDTPTEALAYYESLEQDMANAAAETAFHSQRMSAKARAELAAADKSTSRHVVDVQGKGKRGRPRKVKVISTDAEQPQRVEE
jgi:hypothetical protein